MPHWSFGVRYIHQLMRQTMGNSQIFEVMFPGDPCHAFLMNSNTLAENTLVTAHVLGHADFAKNNHLFARFHEMSGGNIVEHAAAQAHRIEQRDRGGTARSASRRCSTPRSRSSRTSTSTGELHRSRYPEVRRREASAVESGDLSATASAPAGRERAAGARRAASCAPHPAAPGIRPAVVHRQLRARARGLGARHLPRGARRVVLLLPGVRLPHHERGLGLVLARAPAARGRFPAAATSTSTAMKAHSDVVRPFAVGQQTALAINPYHLGFTMWERIVEKHGLDTRARDAARRGRLRLHPQLSRPRAGRRSSASSSTRRSRRRRDQGRQRAT